MKRFFILTLALAVFGSWAVAGPVDLPVPESKAPSEEPATELVETDLGESDAQNVVPAEQEAEWMSPDFQEGNCQIATSDEETRQNAGCTYTCFHPAMCPWIPGQPGASCVNGCCVW